VTAEIERVKRREAEYIATCKIADAKLAAMVVAYDRNRNAPLR
jgi:hypothetical protein